MHVTLIGEPQAIDATNPESYARALELSPNATSVNSLLNCTYLLRGEFERAHAVALREGQNGYQHCALAMIFHATGRREQSDVSMRALINEGDQWGVQIAMAHAYRDERDQAFEWLEKSYSLRDSGIPITMRSPFFVNLLDDPRWPVFLKKIGFPT